MDVAGDRNSAGSRVSCASSEVVQGRRTTAPDAAGEHRNEERQLMVTLLNEFQCGVEAF